MSLDLEETSPIRLEMSPDPREMRPIRLEMSLGPAQMTECLQEMSAIGKTMNDNRRETGGSDAQSAGSAQGSAGD